MIPQASARSFSALLWLLALTLCAATAQTRPAPTSAPTPQPASAQQVLLNRARTLAARNETATAIQLWQQVLLADPKNQEALEGLARAWRMQGNQQKSEQYLLELLRLYPSDPRIAAIEAMPVPAPVQVQLRQAGALAARGQIAQAMDLYRKLYGDTPPDGDIALAYYETEAALPAQRQVAIAGLRTLAAKYPGDARGSIALGKILTEDPSTREEGIALLQPYAAESAAAARAVHQALLWAAQDPAMAPFLRQYLARHPNADWQHEVAQTQRQAGIAPDFTPSATIGLATTPEEIAAFRALHNGKTLQAERQFRTILSGDANDGPAWAGLGFVQEHQQKFAEAEKSFFNAKRLGVPVSLLDEPLRTVHFWRTMQTGSDALQQKQWRAAESAYRDALRQRSGSAEALQGLTAALLAEGRFDDAADVDRRRIQLHPESVDGWSGLLSALVQSGKANAAWEQLQKLPAPVLAQLHNHPGFLQSKASIEVAHGDPSAALKTLRRALQLPISAMPSTQREEMRLQMAGLLARAGETQAALTAYEQVLQTEPENAPAWQGRLAALHDLHQDKEAWRLAQLLPPSVQEEANANPGFLVTLANVAVGVQQLPRAQMDLNAALTQIQKQGGQPSAAILLQVAAISLQSGDPEQAARNYRRALDSQPSDADTYTAWLGLLQALHAAGEDLEARMQEQAMPPALRQRLQQNPEFLLILASIEDALGDTQRAIQNMLLAEVIDQETHRTVRTQQKLTLCWLLYKAHDSSQLLPRLLALNHQSGLSIDEQRQRSQLWIYWSLRRTDRARQFGLYPLAAQMIESAHAAFPQNARLRGTLAGAYIQNHQPQKTVQLYANEKLRMATPEDARAAIGAAMAAAQETTATRWMCEARIRFPQNPALLVLDAQWEKDHDEEGRAISDLQRALPLMASDYQVDRPSQSDLTGESRNRIRQPVAEAPAAASSELPPEERPASIQAMDALGHALAAADQSQPFAAKQQNPSATASAPVPLRYQATALLQQLQGSMSSWLGTTPYLNHRSGTQGLEQMNDVEAPAAISLQWKNSVRLTGIARWVRVQDEAQSSTAPLPLGTAQAGTPSAAQTSQGWAGELQLAARNVDVSAAETPETFPVHNFLGSAAVRTPNLRLKLFFTRDSVRDSELSYAGLHDPGTASNPNAPAAQVAGKIWGGVVSNLGGLDWSHGSARKGVYFTASAGELTGVHVQTNLMARGDGGYYLRLVKSDAGTLMLATNFFGMAYQHDELYFTYGQGGYFSPEYFLLGNFPLTWTGHRGRTLHYDLEGTLGVQDFHQASALYFPLDPAIQAAQNPASSIYAGQSTLGLNYGAQADVAWLMGKHWYLGAFANVNNASNYNQQIGGLSLHYTLHRQHPSAQAPTGFFPYTGINTRRIP
jgi:tetratricopeptide (TPR) repeat protein